MFKKLLIIFFILFSFKSFAIEKKTTFTLNVFNEAQKDFPDVLFLSYEQTKHKDIAKLLNVDFWATIVIYKNSKEVAKEIGVTSKSDIYSLIKKEI